MKKVMCVAGVVLIALVTFSSVTPAEENNPALGTYEGDLSAPWGTRHVVMEINKMKKGRVEGVVEIDNEVNSFRSPLGGTEGKEFRALRGKMNCEFREEGKIFCFQRINKYNTSGFLEKKK